MKLYASSRSERAEKGQGGNTYVSTVYTVEHDTKEREVVATTTVERGEGEFIVHHVPVHGDATVYRVPIKKVCATATVY